MGSKSLAQQGLSMLAVTPYTGVWIETEWADLLEKIKQVTPYTGVWIET